MKTKLLLPALLISTLAIGQTNNQKVIPNVKYKNVATLSEINDTKHADAYPWLSPDGLNLYYTSGANQGQLMYTHRATRNSPFVAPVVVPISVTGDPISYWLSNDELDVYICAHKLYYAHRTSTSAAFSLPIQIELAQSSDDTYFNSASLNQAQTELYVSAFSIGEGYKGIQQYTRTSPTSFNYVRTLPVPQNYTSHTGQLSKNGLIYFCDIAVEDGTEQVYQYSRATLTDPFTLASLQPVNDINNSALEGEQVSVSADLNCIVFVRAAQPYWDDDEIFIAERHLEEEPIFQPVVAQSIDTIHVVEEENQRVEIPVEIQNNINVFPNPTQNNFTVEVINEENQQLLLFDAIGNQILQQTINCTTTIDVSQLANGTYYIHVNNSLGANTQKLIIRR